MNETTKLAFVDELDKIGYLDSFQKRAFFNTLKMMRAAKTLGKAAPKAVKWGPGAGRVGQATRKITAAPAASRSMGAGRVGAGSLVGAV